MHYSNVPGLMISSPVESLDYLRDIENNGLSNINLLSDLSCDEQGSRSLLDSPPTISASLLSSIQIFSECYDYCGSVFRVLSRNIQEIKDFRDSQGFSPEVFEKELETIQGRLSHIFFNVHKIFEIGKLSMEESFFSDSLFLSLATLFKKAERSFVNVRDRLYHLQSQCLYLGKRFPTNLLLYPDFSCGLRFNCSIPNDSYHRELELVGCLILSEFLSSEHQESSPFLREKISPGMRTSCPISNNFFIYVKDFWGYYKNCFERFKILSKRVNFFRSFLEKKGVSSGFFLEELENIEGNILKIFSDIEAVFERGRLSLEKDLFLNQLRIPKFTALFEKIKLYSIKLDRRLNRLEYQFYPEGDVPFYVFDHTAYFPYRPLGLPIEEVAMDGLFLQDLFSIEDEGDMGHIF